MKTNNLTLRIMIGMVLGIVAGYIVNKMGLSPAGMKEASGYFTLASDIFLRLIKMIIAPLVFTPSSPALPTWTTQSRLDALA